MAALNQIVADCQLLDVIKTKNDKYPRLAIGPIDDFGSLQKAFDFKTGTLKQAAGSELEKLLYALSWKQGDVQKLRHIHEGLTANGDEPPDAGMTFWYFGKHLRDPSLNPIVDRNVIAAFAVFNKEKDHSRFKKLNVLSKRKDAEIIRAFVHWYRHSLAKDVRSNKQALSLVDDIIFCLGKRYRAGT